MCHESAFGAKRNHRSGKGTVTLEDFKQAQAIFVSGRIRAQTSRMLTALQQAKLNGCKLVISIRCRSRQTRFKHPQDVVDCLAVELPWADRFLQVRLMAT